jgi:RNA recognition motif-containing protein
MDLLIAELNQHSLPSLPAHQRLKARQINQGAVTEAYNAFLAARSNSNPSLSRADSTSSSSSISTKVPDPRQKDACRTLYVGNLDKHYKEDWLRAKFCEFGHILEVDIKNRESFSPFAFIQFTNIESVVKAIIANQTNKQPAVGQRNERGKLKVCLRKLPKLVN